MEENFLEKRLPIEHIQINCVLQLRRKHLHRWWHELWVRPPKLNSALHVPDTGHLIRVHLWSWREKKKSA